MKGPEAPFLEVNFYFADIPDAVAFVRVLAALTSEGAQFIGTGLIHRGPQINLRPFGGINDELSESVRSSESVLIASLQEAEAYAMAANTRLVQVDMTRASTALHRGREIVGYVSISPEAAAVDHHPIAIWSTGTPFDGPVENKQERRQRQQFGTRVYRRFLNLIRRLEPSYAALTVEYALECPTDLRRDPRSLAFDDFYVSATYLGAQRTAQVLALFPRAYREAVSDGWYISCSGDLNPKNVQVDRNNATDEVAAIIGQLAR